MQAFQQVPHVNEVVLQLYIAGKHKTKTGKGKEKRKEKRGNVERHNMIEWF